MTAEPLAVGDLAPDFTLNDTHGTPVRLADLRGEPVLVVFVPMAFTGTCTSEVCEISDNFAEFEDAGVRVLAITCDPSPSQKVWQETEKLRFDLLSDFWPHGEVAQAYGVFNAERGTAVRASFLLDAGGVVRERIVNPGGQARDFSWYRSAVGVL